MNTKSLPFALCAFAALYLGSPSLPTADAGARQDEQSEQKQGPTLEERVAELESKVVKLQYENELANRRIDETVKYLNAQAKAADAVLATLDESESLGFTKGINFESREVLLSGLRGFWNGAKTGLPKDPTPPVGKNGGGASNGRR